MMTRDEFDALDKDQQDALLKKFGEIQDGMAKIQKESAGLEKPTMKEFEERIKSVMEGYMKNITSVDKKYFMFPGIGNQSEMADNLSPQGKFKKSIEFMKALIGKDATTLNAMHEDVRVKANLSEGTTTAGGFLVPEEFQAEILRLAPKYGVIRREARMIPMKFDILNVPAAGSQDVTASWVNEASQIASTDPNFRQVVLTGNKLASIPKVSNELLEDANVSVISYLAELISEAFAKEEDNQAFNGSGSPFVGVLGATGVPTTPHAGGTAIICLSYTDLVQTTTNIYDNATEGAKFYFHRSVIGHLRSRISTTGAPILAPNQNDIAGYPFVSSEVLPSLSSSTAKTDATAYAIFGNLRRGVAIGERGAMTMKISTEGTVGSDNLFEKDMAALRVIERIAIGVLLPSAFTRLVT